VEEHTFIILAYKQSPYLEDCIRSLKAQSVPSRILIATSTPSDWLKGIGEKYNLPIHVREGKSGMADDWKYALSISQTDLVTLAHQDDLYAPAYAQHMRESAERNVDVLILFSNNDLLIENRHVTRTINLSIQRALLWPFRLRNHVRSRFVRRMTLSFGNPICCPSVTYCMKNLNHLPGGFSFDTTFPNNLDWEAWIRLARCRGSFVYVPEVLMTHRFHRESETSSSLMSNRRHQDDRRIFNQLWPKPIAAAIAGLYALAYRSKHG